MATAVSRAQHRAGACPYRPPSRMARRPSIDFRSSGREFRSGVATEVGGGVSVSSARGPPPPPPRHPTPASCRQCRPRRRRSASKRAGTIACRRSSSTRSGRSDLRSESCQGHAAVMAVEAVLAQARASAPPVGGASPASPRCTAGWVVAMPVWHWVGVSGACRSARGYRRVSLSLVWWELRARADAGPLAPEVESSGGKSTRTVKLVRFYAILGVQPPAHSGSPVSAFLFRPSDLAGNTPSTRL